MSVNEELAGKADPVFSYLLSESLRGAIGMYSTVIPIQIIRPFDLNPMKHRQFQALLKQYVVKLDEAFQENIFPRVFVYVSDGTYRVGELTTGHGSKTEVVINAIDRRVKPFSISELEKACPSVSRVWIKSVLKQPKEDGKLESAGRGRSAHWRKL